MTFRVPLIASVAIVACMFAVSLWAWPVIPDTARIAVHWDAAGNPNGYAAKSSALLFLPLFAAIMAIVLAMPPLLLPKRLGATESRSIYPLVWLGALCLLALAHCATVAAALGIRFNASVAALAGIALFFAAIGLTLRRVLPLAHARSQPCAKRDRPYGGQCVRRGGLHHAGDAGRSRIAGGVSYLRRRHDRVIADTGGTTRHLALRLRAARLEKIILAALRIAIGIRRRLRAPATAHPSPLLPVA